MALSGNRRKLFEQLIYHGELAVSPSPVGGSAERIEPTSYGQRRLWFLDQLQQTEVPYTLHGLQHLQFSIDPTLLQRAINEIVRRHEVLRTTFHMQNDEPVQRIATQAKVLLSVVDLRDRPAAERKSEALSQMGLTIGRRFNLEEGPLLRTELYQLADEEWLFLITVHHIVFDAPSFQVFWGELTTIYGALVVKQTPNLPTVGTQYAEFAVEQRKKLTEKRVANEVAFWAGELADVPMLELPTDRPRTGTPSFRGAHKHVNIPEALVARLQQRTASVKTTLFTVMLAGFWTALSRICGQSDFAVGLPVTGRDTAERQKSIGFYVDTVVVRARMEGDPTTDELIEMAGAAVKRSLSHRILPFEMLVQHLQPTRDLGVNPYFQVGFQLMQHSDQFADPGGFEIARSSTMFDLGFDLWMQGKGIGGSVQFNTDLFDIATVDLVMRVYEKSLAWLTQPGQKLSDLTFDVAEESDHAAILYGERIDVPDRSIVPMITKIMCRQSELPAIEAGDAILSYGELAIRVARLGGALKARGVQKQALIGLELPRSLELTCLQLALLRCGASFVYIDPAWPAARREEIFREAQLSIVIDDIALVTLETMFDTIAASDPEPNDIAYVIFTSGSTGQPKGVQIEHGGLANVILAQRRVFELSQGCRVAQLASPTFDASVFETVLALCSGATLVIAPPETLVGDELAAFLEEKRVDTIVVPPTVLATIEPSTCPSLRLICTAGESCPAYLAQRWSTGRKFFNLYGPTETTIWATYGRTQMGSRVSIGRPIPNLSTVVVDRRLRVVPVGVSGELCIAGRGLARGYLNQPDLTEDRFVELAPFGERFYRTGDLVRQTHGGELIFLGRADRQVKIRGCRIELEEIESVLRSHPRVAEVVVKAVSIEEADTPELVAYLQCNGEEGDIVTECRDLIHTRLPQYMYVSRFLLVSEFPRQASGKIDIESLPRPAGVQPREKRHIEPATTTERRVAELMHHCTTATHVSASDDFFLLGGHSLVAAKLVSRVRAMFKVDLTIRDVFGYPVVAKLAARIDELGRSNVEGEADIEEIPLVRLPRGQLVD